MNKQLLRTMLLLFALVAGSSSAWGADPEVTLDFTNAGSDWKIPTSGTNNDRTSFTNGVYTIYLYSTTNYKANNGYLILGKANSYLEFPAFDFDVEKIEVLGHSGASTSVKQNVFVGENAVSTETTGASGVTNTYEIATDYQAAGNIYKLMITSNHNTQIEYIKIYEKTSGGGGGSDPVAVTGVTIAPTSWEMTVGETKELTATVAPSNATTKTVSWSSDDESVATVSNAGVVTAVAAGTANITVTTTDGSKTAICAVTVHTAPSAAVTFDFSTNIFNVPEGSGNKTTDANDYTYGNYTINLAGGGSGNGYYWHSSGKYLMLGKTDCALTFPAFPFNVSKIKVYGTSGASGDVQQNIFVGGTAVSTATKGAKNVTHEYAIEAEYQAAGNVYVLKVISNHNTQISKIEIFGYAPVTITDAEYATFVAPAALDFSETGITAYTAKANTASVTLNEVTSGKVPAGAAVLLYKAGADDTAINVPVIAEADALEDNDLEAGPVTGDGTSYYVLGKEDEKVGFGLLAAGYGLDANKAYIAASKFGAGAPAFMPFSFGETTGIKAIDNGQLTIDNAVYNLNGQRVAQPSKGLYIVNGRKVVLK